MHCAEFRYGKIELGQAEIRTSRHATGLTLDKLHFSGEDFNIVASGDWLVEWRAHQSNFDIAVKAKALGELLSRFGYRVGNIKHGNTAIDIQAHWNGTPADFALARINGSFELNVSNGRFLDIDPGTGRLFGLLSLQALPRRLTLDFEDLFDKGLVFDSIAGVFQLQDGNAYTNSLLDRRARRRASTLPAAPVSPPRTMISTSSSRRRFRTACRWPARCSAR